MREPVFTMHEKRYRLNGQQLANVRRRTTELTSQQFAGACGWSPSYQSRLERGLVDTVSEATKNVIETVLREYATA